MKSRLCIFAIVLLNASGTQPWKFAEPGFRFQFPRDHFNHSDYQTEWWYYTGNVRTQEGQRFGFELTFFRSALVIAPDARGTAAVWRPDQIYLAHMALSDLDGREFYHDERVNRAGPGLAGIDAARQRYWNGNWQVQWRGEDQELQAVTDEATVSLKLHPVKPVVIHGENGVSIKGPLPGEASHYISFPRLSAAGRIRFHGETLDVAGTAWMDHEFFTEPSDNRLGGWDWFSVQLENGEELMLYRIRRKDSELARFSSGTYVDRDGTAHFLNNEEFALRAVRWWRGYPVDWEIAVSKLGLTLKEHAVLDNQELISRTGTTPNYWEGAVSYSGSLKGKPISGVGYLEMTGYGHPVWLGAK
jgi:predicted secreted hydrolase